MKALLYTTSFLIFAAPAFANITVSSPENGAQVGSPFTLSANATTCSSQYIAAMGYSLDNSTDTTIVKAASIKTQVVSGSGAHIPHVKAWGNEGSVCVVDAAIAVEAAPASPTSIIPSGAIAVGNMQLLSNWVAAHDTGTAGSANGSMSLVNSPSLSGDAREFVNNYTDYGGKRFSLSFGDDTASTHFFYDAWIYLPSSSDSIANLEMDMNQVMPNGQTVIYGFQCDGWSGTWDYTANMGTPTKPVDTWLHAKAGCNPPQWSTNAWHHVQISYSRDDSGNVTYESVALDGVQSTLNATVPSGFALEWSPTLLTNFQLDGDLASNGSATAYLGELTIYRW